MSSRWLRGIAVLGFVWGASAFGAAHADDADAQSDPIAIELEARKVEIDANGAEQLSEAASVRPGDVVEYRATYANQGEGEVSGLKGTLPIPQGMTWVPGSHAPESMEASLDGVDFAPPPLRREVRDADGRTQTVDVPAREYRYLRWNLDRLEPGEKAIVRTRAQVDR